MGKDAGWDAFTLVLADIPVVEGLMAAALLSIPPPPQAEASNTATITQATVRNRALFRSGIVEVVSAADGIAICCWKAGIRAHRCGHFSNAVIKAGESPQGIRVCTRRAEIVAARAAKQNMS
jgi:hypothetical protein